MAATCKYCTCTDERGCEAGCSWSNPERTICSLCAIALEVAQRFVEILGKVAPRARPPIPFVPITWDQLTPEHQQLLVMACRRTADAFREAMLEELTDDAIAAIQEMNTIAKFLIEKCPDQVRDEETTDAIVIRLLAPHVGNRIVAPAGVHL